MKNQKAIDSLISTQEEELFISLFCPCSLHSYTLLVPRSRLMYLIHGRCVGWLFIRKFSSHRSMHCSSHILCLCTPLLSSSSTLTPFRIVVLAPYNCNKTLVNDHQFHSSWLNKTPCIVLFHEGMIHGIACLYAVTLAASWHSSESAGDAYSTSMLLQVYLWGH